MKVIKISENLLFKKCTIYHFCLIVQSKCPKTIGNCIKCVFSLRCENFVELSSMRVVRPKLDINYENSENFQYDCPG